MMKKLLTLAILVELAIWVERAIWAKRVTGTTGAIGSSWLARLSQLAVLLLLCLAVTPSYAGVPEGFFAAYTNETDQIQLIEYIPDGEKIESWTEMYTYMVVKSAEASQYVSFARHFGERIEQSCSGAVIRGQHLDKDGIYLISFECPKSDVAKSQTTKEASESMVTMVSPYKGHVLSVQYAKRGEAGTPPKADAMFKNLFKATHE